MAEQECSRFNSKSNVKLPAWDRFGHKVGNNRKTVDDSKEVSSL